MAELDQVKYDVAIANRILHHTGLATGVTASLGHASLRVPSDPNLFVVKGRGYKMDLLSHMRPEDMVVCDMDGNFVDGPPGSTQCFEVKMHSCILKTHPEIQSVVHIHPRSTIIMTVLQSPIRPMCQEGIQLVRNPLPVWPHVKTVQTDDEGMEVANLLGDNRAILFQGHGAATTGKSLQESVMAMVHLEEQARMNLWGYWAQGPDYTYIPDELVAEMQGRTPMPQLPHFAERMKNMTPTAGAGLWEWYSDEVSKDL